MPNIAVGPMGYVITHFDILPLVVAENIDHAGQSPKEVIPKLTRIMANTWRYLVPVATGQILKGEMN